MLDMQSKYAKCWMSIRVEVDILPEEFDYFLDVAGGNIEELDGIFSEAVSHYYDYLTDKEK